MTPEQAKMAAPVTPPVTPPIAPPRSRGRRWLRTLTVTFAAAVGAVVALAVLGTLLDADSGSADDEPGAETVMSPSPAGGTGDGLPAAEDWIDFDDPDGRFTARLPSQPERSDPEMSGPLPVTQYFAGERDGGVSIIITDFPGNATLDPEAVLSGSAEAAAASLDGDVVTQTLTEVAGVPAIDVEIAGTVQGQTVVTLSRLLLDGSRLYQLQTIGREPLRDAHVALVEGFAITGSGS